MLSVMDFFSINTRICNKLFDECNNAVIVITVIWNPLLCCREFKNKIIEQMLALLC
jgi:hypothetical protein